MPRSRKEFECLGDKFELYVSPEESPNEIFYNVLKKLISLNKESEFRRRFIDTSTFETVGKYIDWKGLVECKHHPKEEKI